MSAAAEAVDPTQSLTLCDVRVEPAREVGTAAGWGGISPSTAVPDWVWTLRDGKPLAFAAQESTDDAARLGGDWIWGGTTVHQPGHFVAEHLTRLLCSVRELPESRVLFVLRKNATIETLSDWFWDLLSWFDIDRTRVGFVEDVPLVVERLTIFPQAEHLTDRLDDKLEDRRLDWTGLPSETYLSALRENLDQKHLDAWQNEFVYVSRGGMPVRLGGERYLESLLKKAGVFVVRPEEHSIADQMRLFAGARHLIFAEGSALHFRQLIGYVPQTITVLTRRTGRMVARGPLLLRCDRLDYIDVARGIVAGPYNRDTGLPVGSSAFPLTDESRLVGALERLGVELRQRWDTVAFDEAMQDDLLDWARYVRRLARDDTRRYALNALVSLAALRQDPTVATRVAHEIEPGSLASAGDVSRLEAERERLTAELESLRASVSLRLGRALLTPAIKAKQWYGRRAR